MGARPSRGVVLLLTVFTVMVGLAGWGAWASWRLAGDAPMSVHGWIAMGIAGIGVGGLTGGFAWLAFYSARRGYDDEQDY